MHLRLSRFIHLLPMGSDRVLVVNAITHARATVDAELASIMAGFARGREVPDQDAARGIVASLRERAILTEKTPEAELQHVVTLLAPYYSRDPNEMIDRFRRGTREGVEPYFTANVALTPKDLAGAKAKVDLLVYGRCDVQMEADFLRRAAAERGIDVRVAASFPDDIRLAGEHDHDAILIGALAGAIRLPGATRIFPMRNSSKTCAGYWTASGNEPQSPS